jgi:hypothetical protein
MARSSTLVLLATLIVACREAPSGPGSSAALPNLAAGASTESGEGVAISHSTFFYACLGETITVDSRIPYRYHRTVAPNGNVHYSEMYIPNAATGTFVGHTSGSVWTLERLVSPFVENVNGAGDHLLFTALILWRSDDGRLVHTQTNLHFKQDAGGDVVLDFNHGQCTVK